MSLSPKTDAFWSSLSPSLSPEMMCAEVLVFCKEMEAGSPWTETPPTEQGAYWHWNGDGDCGPLPVFVLWSGTTGKCFVSSGQLGINHAIDCEEYGGWWKQLFDPVIPTNLSGHPPRHGQDAGRPERSALFRMFLLSPRVPQ